MNTDQWERIIIDDYIPCKKGTKTPKFATPNGRELWVLLLEKAFAKFCGIKSGDGTNTKRSGG